MTGSGANRFSNALPHLGALGASLVAHFSLFAPLAIHQADARLLGIVVLLTLLASPIAGAVVVLRLQGRRGERDRSAVVRPYKRWFIVGVAAMLTLFLEGVFSFFNENLVGVAIIATAFVTLFVVVFLIPTLRFLMWLISPPEYFLQKGGQ